MSKFPLHICIKLYNSLPKSIKIIFNLNQLNKSVYKLLVDIELYDLDKYYSSLNPLSPKLFSLQKLAENLNFCIIKIYETQLIYQFF